MNDDIEQYMLELGSHAREASRLLAAAGSAAKSRALHNIADNLDANRDTLITGKTLMAERKRGLMRRCWTGWN